MLKSSWRYLVLTACGGYLLTSYLLLKHPEILHKKKKKYFHASHISHRGGSAENIENTLKAYSHAVKCGTQMLELDVCFSKDKQVVVSHDPDLSRSTGSEGKIGDSYYQDLPPLKRDLQVTFYKSAYVHHEGEEQKMPTLEAVFKNFPDIPINIDVKEDNEELIFKCHELIKKYGRSHITVWGSHLFVINEKMYNLDQDIPIFFSTRRAVWLYFYFYTGLLPFLPLKETHFEILLPEIAQCACLSKSFKLLLTWCGGILKSKSLIEHLKKRGIPTYVWVLNEEKHYEIAYQLGAEGVMTDYPTKLTKWLNANPKYWA